MFYLYVQQIETWLLKYALWMFLFHIFIQWNQNNISTQSYHIRVLNRATKLKGKYASTLYHIFINLPLKDIKKRLYTKRIFIFPVLSINPFDRLLSTYCNLFLNLFHKSFVLNFVFFICFLLVINFNNRFNQ